MPHSPEQHRTKVVPTLAKIGALTAALIGGCQRTVADDMRKTIDSRVSADAADEASVPQVPAVNRVYSPDAVDRLDTRMDDLKIAYAATVSNIHFLSARISMGDKSETTKAAKEALEEDLQKIKKEWYRLRSWRLVGGSVRG